MIVGAIGTLKFSGLNYNGFLEEKVIKIITPFSSQHKSYFWKGNWCQENKNNIEKKTHQNGKKINIKEWVRSRKFHKNTKIYMVLNNKIKMKLVLLMILLSFMSDELNITIIIKKSFHWLKNLQKTVNFNMKHE